MPGHLLKMGDGIAQERAEAPRAGRVEGRQVLTSPPSPINAFVRIFFAKIPVVHLQLLSFTGNNQLSGLGTACLFQDDDMEVVDVKINRRGGGFTATAGITGPKTVNKCLPPPTVLHNFCS